jgi:ubiquinone/menaquinone biosynthesis C-methylase UbiE
VTGAGGGDAEIWDRLVPEYAGRLALDPPERALLGELRAQLAGMAMLDIGVGAGRTAYTFAALAGRYVGIDFSAGMVDRARALVGEDDRVSFAVVDARDLSRFHGQDFGLVLFSFNGIDGVSHEERLTVLGEVRRVIADGGVFAFSAHSLLALPFSSSPRRPSLRSPLRSSYRSLYRSARLAMLNGRLDLEAARQRGWAQIRDEAHGFSLVQYYVMPAVQIEQLAEAGFDEPRVFDMRGREVDPAAPGRDPHLFYVCRPRP